MQKINLIAQSELSHREKSDDEDDEDEDDEDNDTHQGWIIVRDGMYSVADKNNIVVSSACVPVSLSVSLSLSESANPKLIAWKRDNKQKQ